MLNSLTPAYYLSLFVFGTITMFPLLVLTERLNALCLCKYSQNSLKPQGNNMK